MTHHFFQPVRRNDIKVIVNQSDDLSAGVSDGKIIDGRKVERRVVAQNLDSAFPFKFSQIVQGSGVIRLIIDNDQLEIWIGCFLIDALDAALEQVKSVARGNNERHKWADGKRVFDSPIVTGRGKNPNPERDAIKMGLESSSLRLFNIFLFLHRTGRRSGNRSPMIKYMWNVPDMCGWDAFTDAHGEVPVLAALISHSKPTKFSNNGGAVNA